MSVCVQAGDWQGVEQTSKASDADAEFEAVFAERAEKQTVQRDLTQLSDAKRPGELTLLTCFGCPSLPEACPAASGRVS